VIRDGRTVRRSLEADPSCVYETSKTGTVPIILPRVDVVGTESFQPLLDKNFKYIRGLLNGKVDPAACPVTHFYEYTFPGADATTGT
jgi:hypothetical protein